MAVLQDIAGKKDCNGAEGANTGKKGCTIEMATPKHIIKTPKSFVIPQEQDFNLAYIAEQVQRGNFTPVIGASYFEPTSSDDAYNTNPAGVKRLNLKGLPEYRLTFEEGHEFYKQMSKLESYKDSRFLIGDDEGNWAMAVTSDGDFRGFEIGHVTPEMRKEKVEGGDSEMKSLLFQVINRKEWDLNYEIFLASELEWDTDDIPTIDGVDLEFDAVPANGDTDIILNAVLSSDRKTEVEGLDDTSNFLITVGGSTATISNVVESSSGGQYTITLGAAVNTGQVVTAQLYDSSLNKNVANADGLLYRSNVSSETTS